MNNRDLAIELFGQPYGLAADVYNESFDNGYKLAKKLYNAKSQGCQDGFLAGLQEMENTLLLSESKKADQEYDRACKEFELNWAGVWSRCDNDITSLPRLSRSQMLLMHDRNRSAIESGKRAQTILSLLSDEFKSVYPGKVSVLQVKIDRMMQLTGENPCQI